METHGKSVPKRLFGLRMKSLRKNKGWTQEYLAERMGVTPNYLSSIERGHENPTFNTLLKLSDALKTPLRDMFDIVYEADPREARAVLVKIAKGIDKKQIKMAVKLLQALVP